MTTMSYKIQFLTDTVPIHVFTTNNANSFTIEVDENNQVTKFIDNNGNFSDYIIDIYNSSVFVSITDFDFNILTINNADINNNYLLNASSIEFYNNGVDSKLLIKYDSNSAEEIVNAVYSIVENSVSLSSMITGDGIIFGNNGSITIYGLP
jgi:predicted RNA-binding protein associated with RNAse of E/G family